MLPDLTIKGLNTEVLRPGQSVTVEVVFNPSAVGDRRDSIHILSSKSMENPFDLSLSGIGKR